MPIDWSATGDMLAGIGSISSTVAIIVAAVVGRHAITDYRQQKQAEREIEHAERALTAAYNLDSIIAAVRSPFMAGSEIAESRAELEKTDWFDKESEAKQKRIANANAIYIRFRRFQKDFDDAVATLPFVKAYFGSQAAEALEAIIQCRHKIRVSADSYADDDGSDQEFTKEIRRDIWAVAPAGQTDPIKATVDTAIQTHQRYLLPVVKAGHKDRSNA